MAVYAISDLHGRYDIFEMIKEFLKVGDTCYVLGDCADRGRDGWQIIKEVYADARFFYLKGNHEQMFAEAILGDKSLCFMNGGKKTYEAWRYKDGADRSWCRKLTELPDHELYINDKGQKILLSHSGYTPYDLNEFHFADDYTWNRDHFLDSWCEKEELKDAFIVHGHTPIPLMDMGCDATDKEIPMGAYWYCPDKDGVNHKCNIDSGAVFTGIATMLNLDTFEQITFDGGLIIPQK